MEEVYIVIGSSGQYDEFSTWTVRAFRTLNAATAHANAAIKASGDAYKEYMEFYWSLDLPNPDLTLSEWEERRDLADAFLRKLRERVASLDKEMPISEVANYHVVAVLFTE